MPLSPEDVLRALGLFLLSYIAFGLATSAWASAFPGARHLGPLSASCGISWSAIWAVSIVNPVAEEFVYLGFMANVLRRRSELSAIVAAVVARMAVHVYQGPPRVVGMAAIGAALSVYYLRTRRLWPIVIAHGLIDFVALARMHAGVG